MKRSIACGLLLALLCGKSAAVQAQKAKYVVMISVDGFRPDFYTDASWPTPNMQQMKEEGVYASGVRGVFPTVTYPSHTTLITGVTPGKHGICYNTAFSPDFSNGWNTDASLIKAETLWDAVKKAGLTSASVSWPVSVGAPITYNIPETWSATNPADRREASSEKATPKGLFEEVTQNATGKLQANDYNLSALSMDENVSRMAAYLIRTYKPNLVTLHLPCTDGAQHAEGRNGKGVRRAVASADHAISNILDALEKAGIKDSTAIIITGDHGFVDTHTSLAPNIWLKQNGLFNKAVFFTTGGSTFLHLMDPKDEKTLQQVTNMLAALPESYKKLFKVIDKQQLNQAGADATAALALTAIQGFSFTNASDGEIMKPAKGGTHGYYPDFYEIQTGFIGYGAGFKKGGVLPVIGLEDIAPTVASLLGIELKSADGVTYPGFFDLKK
ncbi:alkaline phosphatase family protein [Filimonas effusa]|uniref:Alkaline phosphatase family protein n=1 Tax=Filimonas effusa TaxID=2508721 RepID=A0A4Q1D9M2_9BACT|nr:ectonucleotide pyrophosphatase/phosphodiesterase [Filimonas effusa]RXK86051.1 alkaline phosphatase family protein [Filimonas effusa]